MHHKSSLLLAVALVAAACGDGGAPYYGLAGMGGEGGAGYSGAAKLEPGECWAELHCEIGKACMPSELTDTPGACVTPPPEELLQLISVSSMRFTDGGSSPDPKTDDFVIEPGTFDVTLRVEIQGGTQGVGPMDLGLPIYVLPGFGFYWQVAMYIRVVAPDDPNYDFECNLAFLRSGDVVGGVVREPGKLLCSTNNWQPPQDPGAPGLLVEYEMCAWPAGPSGCSPN